MKILLYLEKAWLIAATASVIVSIYNLAAIRTFEVHVYFPLICACFCLLIWFNVRGQRKFRDKIFKEGNK